MSSRLEGAIKRRYPIYGQEEQALEKNCATLKWGALRTYGPADM